MAAPSGAIGQWQSLPFPIRLAGIFLAVMAMIWLRRWLGGISVLVALLLWCAIGIGLLHAGGRLAWVDRYPWAARILDGFAPRLSMSTPVPATASPAPTTAAAPPRPGEARERAAPPAPPVAVDLSHFVGLEDVFSDIDELVAARAGRIGPVAPATLVLLVGPRGTGKSSVALRLGAKLHRAHGNSDRIVAIGPAELPGLGGRYGPSEDGLKAISDAAAVSRLDPSNRWLGQLNVRRIDFPPLGTPALQEIFGRLLVEKGLRLAAGADRAVQIQIEERRAQGADEFDNAYAIRRLVDDVLYSHGLRMRGAPEQTPIVTADDVRNARSSL